MMAESSEKVYSVPCWRKAWRQMFSWRQHSVVTWATCICDSMWETLTRQAVEHCARKITCAGTRHCVRVWCPVYIHSMVLKHSATAPSPNLEVSRVTAITLPNSWFHTTSWWIARSRLSLKLNALRMSKKKKTKAEMWYGWHFDVTRSTGCCVVWDVLGLSWRVWSPLQPWGTSH